MTKSAKATPKVVDGLVSVIVPFYNRPELTTSAIDSANAQGYSPLEIVVVDDGSTQSSHDLVASYIEGMDREVTLIRQENSGAPAARRNGVSVARGQFLQFLDSDDRLHPAKIERQVHAMQERGLDYVWSDFAKITRTEDQVTTTEVLLGPRMTSSVCIGLIRRELYDAVGGWNTGLPFSQDWNLSVRIAAATDRVAKHDGVLYFADESAPARITTAKNEARGSRAEQEVAIFRDTLEEVHSVNRRVSRLLAVQALTIMQVAAREDNREAHDTARRWFLANARKATRHYCAALLFPSLNWWRWSRR